MEARSKADRIVNEVAKFGVVDVALCVYVHRESCEIFEVKEDQQDVIKITKPTGFSPDTLDYFFEKLRHHAPSDMSMMVTDVNTWTVHFKQI